MSDLCTYRLWTEKWTNTTKTRRSQHS